MPGLPYPYGDCDCDHCEARYYLDALTDAALHGGTAPRLVAQAVDWYLATQRRRVPAHG